MFNTIFLKIKTPDRGITHPEMPGSFLSYVKWKINLMRPMQFKLPWISFDESGPWTG
jgi:hypothetical protein